jgi:hypothetical protein
MTELGRRIAGAVLILVAIPIALGSFAFGHIVESWDNPDTQCAYDSQKPPIPIEVHGESGMRENGGWSVFPLGLACVFDEPGDGIPAQTVIVPHWPATIVWLASCGAIVLGIVWVVAPRRWFREARAA